MERIFKQNFIESEIVVHYWMKRVQVIQMRFLDFIFKFSFIKLKDFLDEILDKKMRKHWEKRNIFILVVFLIMKDEIFKWLFEFYI